MKTKTTAIPRDTTQIPKPGANPAAALIHDTLEHYSLTQVAAAAAMKISPALLSDVIRQRKGVSPALALRFEACFGVPADFLVRLQSAHDFQKAYHAKGPAIRKQVKRYLTHGRSPS
ncbi:MAG: HigA family addiction module antitoxin [Luteolibacter sp.]